MEGAHSVLVAVVQGDPVLLREKVLPVYEELFGKGQGDPLAPVRLEVIDRATDEALRRLIDAGLIASATRAVRELYPAEAKEPPLSDAERSKSQEYRHQLTRKLKMAQLLGGGGMAEEERETILQSALLLGKALAVERRQPEPKALEDILAPTHSWLWGESHPILCDYAADSDRPAGPFAAALRTLTAAAT